MYQGGHGRGRGHDIATTVLYRKLSMVTKNSKWEPIIVWWEPLPWEGGMLMATKACHHTM